jgi:hypothetical protein
MPWYHWIFCGNSVVFAKVEVIDGLTLNSGAV